MKHSKREKNLKARVEAWDRTLNNPPSQQSDIFKKVGAAGFRKPGSVKK